MGGEVNRRGSRRIELSIEHDLLIAELAGGGFVAAREDSHAVALTAQFCGKPADHRRLARAPSCDVADADDRGAEIRRFANAPVKQEIAKCCGPGIERFNAGK